MHVNTPDQQTQTDAPFERLPTVALIETDRFCQACGYNLRTQPVRRDARTGLLLARCPECGGFQHARDGTTAGRLWLYRLGTALLLLWILIILGVGFGLGAAQVGLCLLPLEELTTWQESTQVTAAPPTTQPGTSQPAITFTPAGGVQQILISGAQTRTRRWIRQVDTDYEHPLLLMTLALGLSTAAGFVLVMLATVILHHWRRWGYLTLLVLASTATAALAWSLWRYRWPHLSPWATPYVVGQAVAHLAGGLTAVWLGRPFARLAASLLLPPRLRQAVAFLWIVDGKSQPTARLPGAPLGSHD